MIDNRDLFIVICSIGNSGKKSFRNMSIGLLFITISMGFDYRCVLIVIVGDDPAQAVESKMKY